MGGFTVQPTGQQTMTQREVDAFIQQVRSEPRKSSPTALWINMVPIMKGKNAGYPVDMYHPTLEMRQALKEEEESALASQGYQRQYIPKNYPKFLFRRNMDEKFAERQGAGTLTIINNAHVEERVVKTEEEERKLRAQKPPAGAGVWCNCLGDIEPMPEQEYVDPQAEIARLKGALEEAQRQSDRPRKA